jgi:hypothetical protein
MRLMLIGLFNMLLGNLLGLIIIGLLGNLALRLLGYDFNIALLTYGAVIAGFVFTVVGFRVQDTVNLALGVTIGILVWSLVGSGLGALLGVGMSLLLSNWSMVPIITGWGLLAGSLVGAAYIYTKPEKWGIWLF